MRFEFWMKVSKSGKISTSKGRPNTTRWDEIAIKMSLQLPKELFERPTLAAAIEIQQSAAPPMEITAETVNNLEEVLRQNGMNVKLTIINSGPQESCPHKWSYTRSERVKSGRWCQACGLSEDTPDWVTSDEQYNQWKNGDGGALPDKI